MGITLYKDTLKSEAAPTADPVVPEQERPAAALEILAKQARDRARPVVSIENSVSVDNSEEESDESDGSDVEEDDFAEDPEHDHIQDWASLNGAEDLQLTRWRAPIPMARILAVLDGAIPTPDPATITCVEDGSFEQYKLYSIGDGEYVLKVNGYINPYYKTASEVASMEYARRQTTIPAPRVIAYSPEAENAIGYEWILMEPASNTCRKTYFEAHPQQRRNDFMIYVPGDALPAIGNIYFTDDVQHKDRDPAGYDISPTVVEQCPEFAVSRMNSLAFTMNDRLRYYPTRWQAKFLTDADWVMAMLASKVVELRCTNREDATVQRLREIMSEILGSGRSPLVLSLPCETLVDQRTGEVFWRWVKWDQVTVVPDWYWGRSQDPRADEKLTFIWVVERYVTEGGLIHGGQMDAIRYIREYSRNRQRLQ